MEIFRRDVVVDFKVAIMLWENNSNGVILLHVSRKDFVDSLGLNRSDGGFIGLVSLFIGVENVDTVQNIVNPFELQTRERKVKFRTFKGKWVLLNRMNQGWSHHFKILIWTMKKTIKN